MTGDSVAILKRLKQLLPQSLRTRIQKARRTGKRIKVQAGRRITPEQLQADLTTLGVASGDILLIHSSLSSIGFIEGGPKKVIDVVLEQLGPKGTLVMPSFPFNTYVAEYLKNNTSFDVEQTPSRMGKITEMFRLLPGVSRSIHPTHPVVALGPAAKELTQGHRDAPSTFGPGSPFERLCALGGKILLIGVDFNSMTNLHVVEDCTPNFPYKIYDPESTVVTITESGGSEYQSKAWAHRIELSALRDCNKMEPYFRDAGVLTTGKIGNADARLMDSAGVLKVMTRLAAEGVTMYFDDQIPTHLRVQV